MENNVVDQVSPMIHVRFEGRSFDIPLTELDVGVLSEDNAIRDAVATHLGVPRVKMNTFAIDKNRVTGDINMHPEAVFGI